MYLGRLSISLCAVINQQVPCDGCELFVRGLGVQQVGRGVPSPKELNCRIGHTVFGCHMFSISAGAVVAVFT